MSSKARFGQIVRARRLELDLTHDQVAARRGPSTTTMTKIEAESGPASVRSDTLRRLDEVLRWQPGSARRTWEGGDPLPLEQPPAGVDQLSDDELLGELARRLSASRKEGEDGAHPAPRSQAPQGAAQGGEVGFPVVQGQAATRNPQPADKAGLRQRKVKAGQREQATELPPD